jgi:hypothetical protein
METTINQVDSFFFNPEKQIIPIAVAVCIGIATKDSIYYILRDVIGMRNDSVTGITPLVIYWITKYIQYKPLTVILKGISAIIAELFIWVLLVSLAYWINVAFLKYNIEYVRWISNKIKQQQQ